ncbi:hypothetical protein LC55x_3407 [Lysobacter capsici]|nr:hypothetical protein LC55x_3407 [Lysobacter capsici]
MLFAQFFMSLWRSGCGLYRDVRERQAGWRRRDSVFFVMTFAFL